MANNEEPNFTYADENLNPNFKSDTASKQDEGLIKLQDVDKTVEYVLGGVKPEVVTQISSSRDRLNDLINVVSALNLSRMAKAIDQVNKVNDLLFDDSRLADMETKDLIALQRNLDTSISNILEFTRRTLTTTEQPQDPRKDIVDKLLQVPSSKLEKLIEKLSDTEDEDFLNLPDVNEVKEPNEDDTNK